MTVFKCKMCGGTLEINNDESVAICEYCGTKQTLPKLDDERRVNLYDRANHFRRNNEFDRAMGIYEQILNEDSSDAEAYWSLVLCRYGIEYVEDPASHKRLPTVNRMQFTSVFDDDNYKLALQYADGQQRSVYEEEAKAINELQKEILAISEKEEPFDVFICYKETDAGGRRTPDAVLANDLYHQLTQEGFKVFFARITLEDKLGTAYEPYIFAALNSAKVMVVLGTKPEYFNAVWVRNEWSRFLALIKSGAKKVLIPAYKDMDPYDLPEEFSHLQAQDMSKLGFMQDLIRGIGKLAQADIPQTTVRERVVEAGGGNIESLLKRAYMFLEDGDWSSADQYCERILDQDPENAMGYLGKLMAELHVHRKEGLADCAQSFENNVNYQKVVRFADDNLAGELKGYISCILERNENTRLESIYTDAINLMRNAATQYDYENAARMFASIKEYKGSDELMKKCHEQAEICKMEAEKEVIENKKANYIHGVKRKKECAIFCFSILCAVSVFILSFVYSGDDYKEVGNAISWKRWHGGIAVYRFFRYRRLGTFVPSLSHIEFIGIFVVVILLALIPLLYYIAQDLYWSEQYKKAYILYKITFCFKDSIWMAHICYGLAMEREKRYFAALESLRKVSAKAKREDLRVQSNDIITKIEKLLEEMEKSERGI